MPILDGELSIGTQVCIDRHTIFHEIVAKLRPKTEGPALEIAKFRRLSQFRGQLNIGVARRPHEELLIEETRETNNKVGIYAAGNICFDVLHVVGDADCD